MTHTPRPTARPLIDRYVADVARRLPAPLRADVGEELRAGLLDAIDDRRAADPALTPEQAERAAVAALGDPAVLADGYLPERRYVIGPAYYDEWSTLLRTLLAIVPATAATASLVIGLWADDAGFFGVLGDAVWLGLVVAVNIAFWVTVTFWLLERSGTPLRDGEPRPWHPDDLPPAAPERTITVADLAWGVAVGAIGIGWVLWQHYRPLIQGPSGDRFEVLDPALWPEWAWGLIGVLALGVVAEVIGFAIGRWTLAVTAFSVFTDLAIAAYVVVLVQRQELVNPALVALADNDVVTGANIERVVLLGVVIAAAISIVDAVKGHVRDRRAPA